LNVTAVSGLVPERTVMMPLSASAIVPPAAMRARSAALCACPRRVATVHSFPSALSPCAHRHPRIDVISPWPSVSEPFQFVGALSFMPKRNRSETESLEGCEAGAAHSFSECTAHIETTINVTAEKYFQNIFPVMEPYVYDASYTKLRELRFGFDLPATWAGTFNAHAVSLAVTGRNLHTWTKVPNIDPEFSYTVGNFQGVEFGALPNMRSWGLSFRITP